MDAVADDDKGKKVEIPEEKTEDTVEPTEPKPVDTTIVIVAEGGGKVNIRAGYDTSCKRITTVPAGTTFEFVATTANGWNAHNSTNLQTKAVASMLSITILLHNWGIPYAGKALEY